MAYSDYGGYAYRNGVRVEDRSDCTITPEGDTFGTPGMWPGFATLGLPKEEREKRLDWPSGHAVLGDGPVYAVLYKAAWLRVFRGPEELETGYDSEYHREFKRPFEVTVDGVKLIAHWTEEDNHYLYVRLEQPDGAIWHGWSGYGVGAGLEHADYGYSTEARNEKLLELWPDAIL
jgi:hypothetical protein